MKTYYEKLSDIAEHGMQIEQEIRLCVSRMEGYELIGNEYSQKKIKALKRLKRIIENHLKNYKENERNY